MRNLDHYHHLALLFDYPDEQYPTRVAELVQFLGPRYPRAAALLQTFADALPPNDGTFSEPALDEVQEIFTRSFDVQSITTLGVGYVVFGDDYKRGELLVNLNRETRDAGIDCGPELPDHLPNVLRLLAVWPDEELQLEFVQEILHPALDTMIAEFGDERMEKRNHLYKKHYKTLINTSAERGTLFRTILQVLREVIGEDFELLEPQEPRARSEFLHSISREMAIEEANARPANPEQQARMK